MSDREAVPQYKRVVRDSGEYLVAHPEGMVVASFDSDVPTGVQEDIVRRLNSPAAPAGACWTVEGLAARIESLLATGYGPNTSREVARIALSRPVAATERPTVVCLCGSTRFMDTFAQANYDETMAGRIVLSVGCRTSSDGGSRLDAADKVRLDALHRQKIDMADEVLVLNVGGYVGDSTRSEIEYAEAHGKRVRWLEAPERAEGCDMCHGKRYIDGVRHGDAIIGSARPCPKCSPEGR